MGTDADSRVEEGNVRLRAGDTAGALDCYEAAVGVDPSHARAHFNLGVVLHGLGRLQEAAAHFDSAVRARRDFPAALVNWGNVLKDLGDLHGAGDRYRRALRIDPGDRHALNNLLALGSLLRAKGDAAAAIAANEAILEAAPEEAAAHYNLGLVLQQLHRDDEAIAHYARAALARPGFVEPLVNWGNILLGQADLAGAADLYRRALAIQPGNAHALNNLATVALERGEFDEAQDLYLKAADAQKPFDDALYNLGLLALRSHDFERGWDLYELRFRSTPAVPVRVIAGVPRMERDALSRGQKLAVWTEQGIGDQILFSTLLPELSEHGIQAVVEVDARLLQAYRRSLPAIEFLAQGEADAAFAGCDHELPLGSLPRLFRRSLDRFSAQPGTLLRPDSSRVREMGTRLPRERKIGIAWRTFQGAGLKHMQARKSIPLACFGIFEGSGRKLVDLQYGDAGTERSDFDMRHPGLRHEVEGLDSFNDLEGLMAAIEACDLVVTSSNITAHLAGAIGKRTWLVYLAANAPFHYWVPGPDGRSLWYPSVEIMTDTSWTTWEQAFEAVAARWRREN